MFLFLQKTINEFHNVHNARNSKKSPKRFRITGISLHCLHSEFFFHTIVKMMHSMAFFEIITCMHDSRYQTSERNLWPYVCPFFQLIPFTQSSIFTNDSQRCRQDLSIICVVATYLFFSFHYGASLLNIWFIVINKYLLFGPNTQFNEFVVVSRSLVFTFIIFENETVISL